MRQVRTTALLAASLIAAAAQVHAQPGDAGRRPAPPPPAEKDALVPPVLKQFVDAPYPPEAEKAKKEGVVVLQLDVDATGKVTQVVVLSPAGSGFDEAAMDAARKFEFSPATKNGKAVPARITFRYTFSLKEKPADPGTGDKPKDAPPPTVLRGVVDIGQTGVHLRGAVVTVRGPDGFAAELTTGDDGGWVIRDLPPGKYSVTVKAPGFESVVVDEEVDLGKATEVLYRMREAGGGNEIIVRGERPPREVTKRTLERREVSRIPGTNGDALRAIQNLPGVARPPGLVGFLIVRGSSPNDTQVFVDGALVPLAYHFGGLSSVVPTEMIDKLDFYPGNFSAQYGRVMGGIVDVGLRSPSTDGKYHGLVQFDLIDGRFMLEGPLPVFKSKNVRFVVGARRSWVDVWLKPALEQAGAGVTSAPVYYDYQAFIEAEPTPKSKIRAGVYGSDDRLEILIRSPLAADPVLGGNIGLHTGFWRAQATYLNELDDSTRFKGMVSYGGNTFNFSLGSLYFILDIKQMTSRMELSRKITKGVTFNVGQDMLYAPYDIDIRLPQPPRPGEPDPGPFAARPPVVFKGTDTLYRPAAYAEVEILPSERGRIVAGYRADYARDTSRWDSSPRLNGRFVVIPQYPKTTVKGGVGVFHQPPQPQETNVVYGTPGIRSNRAIHYSAGVEQDVTRKIDVSVEGFYKQLDDIVSRTASPNGAFQYNNLGSGYVVGAETLLRYKADSRFFGWIAYTLSRSMRRNSPAESLQLFQYDQTHILTALGSYRLGRGWEFGLRFRYVSGPLEQPCLGGIFNSAAGAYACVNGSGFTQRLPAFHQLDLRLDKTWVYTGGWKLHAYLDVLNVYNRQNPEALQYNYNYSQSTYQTGLPLIPSLGVRAEFLAMKKHLPKPFRSLAALGAVTLAAGAALPACGAAFESQASIQSLRVMGVVADPPYGKPGKTVSLDMLYFDGSKRAYLPDGSRDPEHKVNILWLGGCHNPPGDLYYACFPILAEKLSSLLGPDGTMQGPPPKELLEYVQLGSKAVFKIPDDAISGRPQNDGAVPYALSYVFFIACGGDIGPMPAGSKTGFPIGCYDPKTKAALSEDDFVVGYTPIYSYEKLVNKNPVIKGGTFKRTDQDTERFVYPSTACMGDDACKAYEKCGSSGFCIPKVPHCTAKKAQDCTTYELRPIMEAADNVEIDEASPEYQGKQPEESIWVAYYASDGTLEEELRLVNDAQKGWQDSYETHWSAPNAPAGESRVWGVVHDNRGGTAYWWWDIYVE